MQDATYARVLEVARSAAIAGQCIYLGMDGISLAVALFVPLPYCSHAAFFLRRVYSGILSPSLKALETLRVFYVIATFFFFGEATGRLAGRAVDPKHSDSIRPILTIRTIQSSLANLTIAYTLKHPRRSRLCMLPFQ